MNIIDVSFRSDKFIIKNIEKRLRSIERAANNSLCEGSLTITYAGVDLNSSRWQFDVLAFVKTYKKYNHFFAITDKLTVALLLA